MKKSVCSIFIFLCANGVFPSLSKANLIKANSNLEIIGKNRCNEMGAPHRVMVMVPGTLNSLVPGAPEDAISANGNQFPYFSMAVRQVMESHFCAVHIISGLDYFGEFKKNGEHTFEQTLSWYNALISELDYKPEVWFYGHSAGGLYSLYAAHLNERNKAFQSLPIKKIVTMATPFNGVEFIDKLTSYNSFVAELVQKFIETAWSIDLKGLWGLKKQNVRIFLYNLKLDPQIEIHSFAGAQSTTYSANEIMNAIFLSPPLNALQKLINSVSDGMVSLASVFNQTILNKQTQDPIQYLYVQSHNDYQINLDHIEQVWDYRYLKVLGTTNSDYVLEQQIKVYNDILQMSGI